MITVLILGHKGMLGHMLCKYLQQHNINIVYSNKRWPGHICKDIQNFKGDYIVNCMGAIPQKTNNFSVNYELPIWLDQNTTCKIIHVGTNSGLTDEYSISKKQSLDWILSNSKQTKIIQTSIIGPELTSNKNLFEWFMEQKTSADGYTNEMWNGITTLEWCKLCYKIIKKWDKYDILNIPYTDCISKYNLLYYIKESFNKCITIHKTVNNKNTNECIDGNIKLKDIKKQLTELKRFYYDN